MRSDTQQFLASRFQPNENAIRSPSPEMGTRDKRTAGREAKQPRISNVTDRLTQMTEELVNRPRAQEACVAVLFHSPHMHLV